MVFLDMCADIGISIASDKTFPANTIMIFVGISLDTIRMEASLPADKLHKCKELLSLYSRKSSCTLWELQSLIGFLNFCCFVITCGKAFLRRLINLTIGVQKPFHYIRLNKGVKADLALWLKFLSSNTLKVVYR